MSNRITMADIAREAGVSLMTVSRVVNHKGEVSSRTRKRIEAVIERLGYRPSGIARGLATQRTGTIGLVVPDVANPFFADIAFGVEQQAGSRGYNVFLCNTSEDPKRELDVLHSLEEKRVDGVILCSSRLDEFDLFSVLDRYPAAVMVNRPVDRIEIGTVMVDDLAGGYLATRHLLKTGHHMIGYLAGPNVSFSGRQRKEGYRIALDEEGVSYDTARVLPCAPVVKGGMDAAQQLLDSDPTLTALFCYNDLVAVGALRTCEKLGFAVPGDIAVVGYDDIHLAHLVTPPLTTCRVPRVELGEQAVHLLLGRINGNGENESSVTLQPELVVRASAP